jgi:transposase
LVFSQQAYERENKTFMKRIDKEFSQCKKACKHLANQLFSCQEDAQKNLAQIEKKKLMTKRLLSSMSKFVD